MVHVHCIHIYLVAVACIHTLYIYLWNRLTMAYMQLKVCIKVQCSSEGLLAAVSCNHSSFASALAELAA